MTRVDTVGGPIPIVAEAWHLADLADRIVRTVPCGGGGMRWDEMEQVGIGLAHAEWKSGELGGSGSKVKM
ncbi:hypothetical protein PG996_014851 [Apiospora saccharicola]|uniref:Uncharacterized protein n=1 Tax=Apiospora saccharicola TaxID=335842 RepID=A0ABR1TJL7_9PEZI